MIRCFLSGFPDSSVGKESAYTVGDLGSIPGLGRSPGEGKGYTLHSGLENSIDSIVCGVAESDTIESLSLSLFRAFNRGDSVRLYFWGLQNHCRW